ncbi:hypothetical protein U6G28_01205 [Actinomycetaceae bacterium MB13-C1-2]|nr:hypothetical protein U6G28_01205 [Actinomycetaceae bacterium MB13-C1-2]
MSGNDPANPYGPPEASGEPTPPEAAGAPQFGQRSENWTPKPDGPPNSQVPGAPQFGQRSETWSPGGQNNGAAPDVPDSPWPVYGELGSNGQPGASGGQFPPGQYGQPGGQSQQGPYPGQNSYPPRQGPYYGGQYPSQDQYPQGQYGTPTPYSQGQNPAPTGEMPSRTGAILTLVGGIFLMVIVAPILFFSLVINAVGTDRLMEGGLQASNGGVMNVGPAGVVAVLPLSGEATSCTATDSTGTATEMYYEVESGGTYVGRGLVEGQYTIECEGVPTGAALMVLDGTVLGEIVDGTVQAIVWATVVGLAGLGLTIGGIIWLVRRNQARKAYLRGRPY